MNMYQMQRCNRDRQDMYSGLEMYLTFIEQDNPLSVILKDTLKV